MSEPEAAADWAEAGRKLFAGPCEFIFAAARSDGLPPIGAPEVAFAGRSNVGKSSLVNALTGHSSLARTSRTPGRTQELIFFDLHGQATLVDMPGYGYAAASKGKSAAWGELMRDYLSGRPTLLRVFVLVDGRHGLKESDQETMRLLDAAAVSYAIVMTKGDERRPPTKARGSRRRSRRYASTWRPFRKCCSRPPAAAKGSPKPQAHVARLLVETGATQI